MFEQVYGKLVFCRSRSHILRCKIKFTFLKNDKVSRGNWGIVQRVRRFYDFSSSLCLSIISRTGLAVGTAELNFSHMSRQMHACAKSTVTLFAFPRLCSIVVSVTTRVLLSKKMYNKFNDHAHRARRNKISRHKVSSFVCMHMSGFTRSNSRWQFLLGFCSNICLTSGELIHREFCLHKLNGIERWTVSWCGAGRLPTRRELYMRIHCGGQE